MGIVLDIIKYEILTEDKRYNHIGKFQNYIVNTCETLKWRYIINNQNTVSCEIALEKFVEYEKVAFILTITLILCL